MSQTITPDDAWPSVWTTLADLDQASGANFLAMSQQYANALRTMQLAALMPFQVISHGGNSGVNQWGMYLPRRGTHWIGGDEGWVRCPGPSATGIYLSSSATGEYAVGAAASWGEVMVRGTGAGAGTQTTIAIDGTLTSGVGPNIGVPYDAVSAEYSALLLFTGAIGVNWYVDAYDGANWTSTALTFNGGAIAASPDGRKVLIGSLSSSNTKVAVSDDGGATWSEVSHGIAGNGVVYGAAYDDARARWVINRGQKVYTAADVTNPTSWTERATIGSSGHSMTKTLACLPGGLLLLLTFDGATGHDLMASHDGGVSWEKLCHFEPSANTKIGLFSPTKIIYANGYVHIVGGDDLSLVSRRIA